MSKPFMERVLIGDVLDLSEIDVDIERWHKSPTDGTEIFDWLGMSWPEYQLFVERPETLPLIIQARRYGLSLQTLVGESQPHEALAARGATSEELLELRQWLKKTGRL